MVRIILEDGSSIRVWAAEDLDCFVFDDDFRVLVLDEALTTGIMKLKAERSDVLKQGLAAAMECTFIHFPLVFFNHWTLPVLNTLNGRWDFYNSLARLNKKHVEKAKQLANQIANDINTIMVEGTVRITNKICKFVPSLYGPAQKRNLSGRSFCFLEVCTYPGLESESKSPAHAAEERFGVLLLLNLGGPDMLNDVQPFWFNLFADLEGEECFNRRAIAFEEDNRRSPLRKITDDQVEEDNDDKDDEDDDDDDDDEDDDVEEDDDDNDENDDNEDDEDEDKDEDEDDGDEDKGTNDMHYQQVITNGHKSPLANL
ncbi:hypothetical protein RHGRI_007127 [Rhododendron griersonianum]|uniref:Uncharacterized protein n=1 Tax=Rhododendron griersonianum TaxID=479676 RepID=A0AAV6KWD9_9ERIC|nr:hypothetical protein RHGRI_007127 [Rhododendron griersonianum]